MFNGAGTDMESFATVFEQWFADLRDGVADAMSTQGAWTIVEYGSGDAISIERVDDYDLELLVGKRVGRAMTECEKLMVKIDGNHRPVAIKKKGRPIDKASLEKLVDAMWGAYRSFKQGDAARLPDDAQLLAA